MDKVGELVVSKATDKSLELLKRTVDDVEAGDEDEDEDDEFEVIEEDDEIDFDDDTDDDEEEKEG